MSDNLIDQRDRTDRDFSRPVLGPEDNDTDPMNPGEGDFNKKVERDIFNDLTAKARDAFAAGNVALGLELLRGAYSGVDSDGSAELRRFIASDEAQEFMDYFGIPGTVAELREYTEADARVVAEDPDGSTVPDADAKAKAAQEQEMRQRVADADANAKRLEEEAAQRITDAAAKKAQEQEMRQRVADAERKRQQDLIDSDVGESPTRVEDITHPDTFPPKVGIDSTLIKPDPETGLCPSGMIKVGGGVYGGSAIPEYCIVVTPSDGTPTTDDGKPDDGKPDAGTSTPDDVTPQTDGERRAAEIIAAGEGTPEEKKSLLARTLEWLRGKSTLGGIASLALPAWLIGAMGGGSGGGSDPSTGGGSDPSTGGGSDPSTGGGSDPSTGGGSDPSTGGGSATPGAGNFPELTTGEQVYKHIDATGTTDGLTEKQIADAADYAKAQPSGVVPNWLLALLGLGAALGGSSNDSAPTSLQEAAARRSMEVYGNADLFDPEGPSPLQTLDPAFRDIKTFMPAGQVPDFNLNYRGVPGQMYANYEGTGPRGVAGLRGNINPIAQVAQGGLMGLANGGSTSYPRMNGQISGPGTEKSDDIPAMLSDGEFVVNSAAVRGIGNLMGNKKPKSKAAQRREGARMMYALQKAGEKAARMT